MNFVRPALKISVIVIIPNIVVIIWFELPLRTQFKQFFLDTLNPFCCCHNVGIESSFHYLLHCLPYLNVQTSFLDNVIRVYPNIFSSKLLNLYSNFPFWTIIKWWNEHHYFKLIDWLNMFDQKIWEELFIDNWCEAKNLLNNIFFSYSFIWLLKCCKNRGSYYMFYIFII